MTPLLEIPRYPYLSGRCQRASNVGPHSLVQRLQWRLRSGLGLRPALRSLLKGGEADPASPVGLGEPSQYAVGAFVRVRAEAEIRQLLDARQRTRGLEFGKQQWPTCGHVYRVSGVVRRIIDDDGRLRRVNRTVLLDGVHCDSLGTRAGCGRECPMMYRDEWLEPAGESAADSPAATDTVQGWATVRSAEEIARSLDPLGRTDSLLFMPEMLRYCGQTLPIARVITRVWEMERWGDLRHPIYVLQGVSCSGAVLGADGPCDRACVSLWHERWLRISPAREADAG